MIDSLVHGFRNLIVNLFMFVLLGVAVGAAVMTFTTLRAWWERRQDKVAEPRLALASIVEEPVAEVLAPEVDSQWFDDIVEHRLGEAALRGEVTEALTVIAASLGPMVERVCADFLRATTGKPGQFTRTIEAGELYWCGSVCRQEAGQHSTSPVTLYVHFRVTDVTLACSTSTGPDGPAAIGTEITESDLADALQRWYAESWRLEQGLA